MSGELIPALTRDTAARIIAGRADAPPHLFTVVTAVAEAEEDGPTHVFHHQ